VPLPLATLVNHLHATLQTMGGVNCELAILTMPSAKLAVAEAMTEAYIGHLVERVSAILRTGD